jgi:hypothetical protein
MKQLNEYLENVISNFKVMLFYWDNFSFCYIGKFKLEKEENLFKKDIK